jgi:hypothetical protein
MNKRSLYQSFGYGVKEPSIQNPELAMEGLRELAHQGYDLVRVFLRGSNFEWRSPEYVSLIAKMTAEAHRLGMKIAIDCEPHTQIAGREMGKEFPAGMGRRMYRAATQLAAGRFAITFPSRHGAQPNPRLEAAFVRQGDTVTKLPTLAFGVNFEEEFYDTGFAERYVDYTPGRGPIQARHYFHLHGRLPSPAEGELIVYVSFEDEKLIDFWSAATREFYVSVVECYKAIPLDGISWDEPAAEVGWECYRWGDASAAAFARVNGYDLRDKLYLLDEPQITPEAVKVKLDYYRTLNEGVFQAQKHVCDMARAKCGTGAILGTHHTWVGEGGIGDFRAGAVDYFRLNENMDAGYTDGVWWFDGCIDYIYALGSSLGRLTPSGCTEINTWHWKPTIAATEHAARLMALMRINWFNIWIGDMSDTAKYPEHYSYDVCTDAMRKLKGFLAELEPCRPVVDVAIWHGWEGVMATNSQEWTFGLKNFQLFGSEALARRSIAFDFVDSELLKDARIENGQLVTRLERYRVLVMPYAMVMPEKVWATCLAFAAAGGKVIFIGPPPALTVEGREIGAEFAASAGIQPLSFATFKQSVTSRCQLSLNGPHRWDVNVPLDLTDGVLIPNREQEPSGVKNQAGTFFYLSELVPRGELADMLETLVPPAVTCHSKSIEWRLYRQADGTQKLMLIATKFRRMSGLIRWAGHEIEIQDGLQAMATVGSDGKLAIHGDELECASPTVTGSSA